MRVIVRADASPKIGGGHIMRCLALADALARRGASCAFACAEVTAPLADRIRSSQHELIQIISPLAGRGLADRGPLPRDLQEQDSHAFSAAAGAADWLIVDHYGLDRIWEDCNSRNGTRILAFDDLANRSHCCDILLDQTLGRVAEDYRLLVPTGSRILTGPQFAPLRPEFAAMRNQALAQRSRRVQRLLISLGSTDLGGATALVLREALSSGLDLSVDVVIGAVAPSLAACRDIARTNVRVRLFEDTDEMASLMMHADIAIGAAGATSWERCCLGLPALVLVLAENQRLIASELQQAGAHQLVEPGAIGTSLWELVRDDERRTDMATRASRLTDGQGADRICDAVLGTAEVEKE